MKKIAMCVIVMTIVVSSISVQAFQTELYVNQGTRQACSFIYSNIPQNDRNVLINKVAQKVLLHLAKENIKNFNSCIAKHGEKKFIEAALPIFEYTEKTLRENYPGWFIVYVYKGGVIDPWDYMDRSDTDKIRKDFENLMASL